MVAAQDLSIYLALLFGSQHGLHATPVQRAQQTDCDRFEGSVVTWRSAVSSIDPDMSGTAFALKVPPGSTSGSATMRGLGFVILNG